MLSGSHSAIPQLSRQHSVKGKLMRSTHQLHVDRRFQV